MTSERNNDIGRPTVVLAASRHVLPVSGGAAARLWSLSDHLRQCGFRVCLITYQHADHLEDAIRARVDAYWPLARQMSRAPIASPRKSLLGWLGTTLRACLARRRPIPPQATSFFIKRQDIRFDALVARVCEAENPVVLISLYAWSATAFDHIAQDTVCIIDTIDVQHIRLERALAAGAKLEGFDPPPRKEEEAALLSKANAVIAIQAEEQRILKEILPDTPVLLAEHMHAVMPAPAPVDSRTIFFVGNNYAPNVEAMQRFIKETWPLVKARCGDCELIICGRVCEVLAVPPDTNIKCLGVVDDLTPFYRDAALVINPITFGTGLKIKAVEALAYGKCLVATEQGVEGLPGNVHECACIVSSGDMADAIVALLNNVDERREFEARAARYAACHLDAKNVYGEIVDYLKSTCGLSSLGCGT